MKTKTMPTFCPICKPQPAFQAPGQVAHPSTDMHCPACGPFKLAAGTAQTCVQKYARQAWQIAAYVRERTSQGFDVVLYPSHADIPDGAPAGSIGLDRALETFPKTVGERLDRVLLNLDRQSNYLGERIALGQNHYPTLFARHVKEAMFVLHTLSNEGYIENYRATYQAEVNLSAKGLARVAELQRGVLGPANKQVFVAMSFDKSLQDAWQQGLKLGIEDCGYTALRIDAKEHNEKICDAIIAEIRKSKFLVADFTMHRNGVYFEAGLMMGLGRPVVFTCRSGDIDDAHFDTRQYSHVRWETPAQLREALKRRISATILP